MFWLLLFLVALVVVEAIVLTVVVVNVVGLVECFGVVQAICCW